jgi:hypothetical protein
LMARTGDLTVNAREIRFGRVRRVRASLVR